MRDLKRRLAEAGVDPAERDPQAAFERLVARFGRDAVTLEDRLALQARARGVRVARLSSADRQAATEGFYGLRWDGFQIVGEERGDSLEFAAYDPGWPRRFAAWRERLAGALGAVARRIEHVGSTAVAGLDAKPIVDIQISVIELEAEARYVPAIDRAGVALRSRDAEHRYFRPPPGAPRDVHVHVCAQDSAWERDHLLFRDSLRAQPSLRRAYAELKRGLARRFPDDRLGYTEGKSAFVRAALADARRWDARGRL